jgi:uncharacterized protein (TIGR02001 family)
MRTTLVVGVAVATLVSTGRSACADPGPAPPRGLCSGLYLAATATSDYRYDGLSESNRSPTWQLNLHCFRTDGWYLGTQLAGVDFEEQPRPTRLEIDTYGGRHIPLAGNDLDLEVLYYAYPDKRSPGPTYDSFLLEGELSRKIGKLTLTGHVDWTPEGSGHTGPGWRVRATADYAPTSWFSITGNVGQIWSERGQDRAFGYFGAKATWRRLSLDARYWATDLKPSQCFFTDWCAPGLSVALTWRLLP